MGANTLDQLTALLAHGKKPKPEHDPSGSGDEDSSDSHDDDPTEDTGTMEAPSFPTYQIDSVIDHDDVTPV